jgi:hypothetical protein
MTTINLTEFQAESLRHITLMAWTDLELADPRWNSYREIFEAILEVVPFKTTAE